MLIFDIIEDDIYQQTLDNIFIMVIINCFSLMECKLIFSKITLPFPKCYINSSNHIKCSSKKCWNWREQILDILLGWKIQF